MIILVFVIATKEKNGASQSLRAPFAFITNNNSKTIQSEGEKKKYRKKLGGQKIIAYLCNRIYI